MEDEVAVLRIRLEKLEAENERLLGDNRRLQLLTTRRMAPMSSGDDSSNSNDVNQLKERVWELEIEVG